MALITMSSPHQGLLRHMRTVHRTVLRGLALDTSNEPDYRRDNAAPFDHRPLLAGHKNEGPSARTPGVYITGPVSECACAW